MDYRVIINSDIYVALERQILRTERQKQNKQDAATDNRKVVVEDLLYIDDLEVVIFTTVAPKSSTIWASSTRKSKVTAEGDEADKLKSGLQKMDLENEN